MQISMKIKNRIAKYIFCYLFIKLCFIILKIIQSQNNQQPAAKRQVNGKNITIIKIS